MVVTSPISTVACACSRRSQSSINLALFHVTWRNLATVRYYECSWRKVFGWDFSMSHVVLNYGWFGWNSMPAWIASVDGRALKQCRIVDLDGDHAKLEVDRA